MNVGTVFTRRGQRYRCIDWRHHTTRDGRRLLLPVLESLCPDCGREFQCMATITAVRHGKLVRRCWRCRAPGVRVKRKARLAVKRPTTEKAAKLASVQPDAASREWAAAVVRDLKRRKLARRARGQAAAARAAAERLRELETEDEAVRETYRFALGMM
jgi:hypothetical protein